MEEKDIVQRAVDLSDGPDDVDDRIEELSACVGTREDRIAAMASRL